MARNVCQATFTSEEVLQRAFRVPPSCNTMGRGPTVAALIACTICVTPEVYRTRRGQTEHSEEFNAFIASCKCVRDTYSSPSARTLS